jgi:hypothetical protein
MQHSYKMINSALVASGSGVRLAHAPMLASSLTRLVHEEAVLKWGGVCRLGRVTEQQLTSQSGNTDITP